MRHPLLDRTIEKQYPAHERSIEILLHPETGDLIVGVSDHRWKYVIPDYYEVPTMQEARRLARREATKPRRYAR